MALGKKFEKRLSNRFFCLNNHVISDNISYMCLEGLIPLKCCALLDLSRKENPSQKDFANIEKHRQDIFRLADGLPDGSFPLPEKVAAVTTEALNRIAETALIETEVELLAMLRQFYNL